LRLLLAKAYVGDFLSLIIHTHSLTFSISLQIACKMYDECAELLGDTQSHEELASDVHFSFSLSLSLSLSSSLSFSFVLSHFSLSHRWFAFRSLRRFVYCVVTWQRRWTIGSLRESGIFAHSAVTPSATMRSTISRRHTLSPSSKRLT
jgi:hypothetical protein